MARLSMLAPRVAVADTRSAKPAPKTVDPIYQTPEYRAWRAEVIRRSGGACQDPAHDPRQPRAGRRLYADHVHELRDGGSPFDPANGLARCASCHTRKTAVARAARHGAPQQR